MPLLELKHLRTLQAIKEKGSLVEAADSVHLTQSAISHQIKDLEERLDCTLLIRKSRPLQFTPAGEKLLALAKEVLPKVTSTEQALRQMAGGDSGRLHIAIECHSCFEWLLPTLDNFRQLWPGVEMDLGTGFSFNGLHALSRGQIDLVITADPNDDPDLHFAPLFQFPMVLVHGNRHWLRDKAFIEPQDLADETLIIYPVDPARLSIFSNFLNPAGVFPAQTRQTELTLMMIQLVASELGVCVLPNWAVAEYLRKNFVAAKPLGEHGLWCTLYAAVHRDHVGLNYIKDFIRLARTLPFKHLEGIEACDAATSQRSQSKRS
jgi:LysR family transcriptional regulator for metE and metH